MEEQASTTLEKIDSESIVHRLLGMTQGTALPTEPHAPVDSRAVEDVPRVVSSYAEESEPSHSLTDFELKPESIDSHHAAELLMARVFPLASGPNVSDVPQKAAEALASSSPGPSSLASGRSPAEAATPHRQTTDQFKRRIDELSSKLSLNSSAFQGSSGIESLKGSLNPPATIRSPLPSPSFRRFDVESVRADFPALHQKINGHPLVWFDNAATTHKPLSVINAISDFYRRDYSNIHRAAHTLAARSTDAYEDAREQVRQLLNARNVGDIVFVRGTTEGMNFIANTAKSFLKERDEILVTELEHHANIVPWQMIAQETGARLRVVPINDKGEILFDEYRRMLGSKTRIVSFTHASNTLGTVLPIHEMTQLAKKHHACVVIDGAQSVAHLPIDVQSLDCDFFVFSGHKVFAPTGIGAVYVAPHLQERLPPWQGGGNMIVSVRFDDTVYAPPPAKFEAGTPSIGDAVGLGSAIRYLRQFDFAELEAHEHALLEVATQGLQKIKGVTTYGHADHKLGLVSFTVDGQETTAVGKELDRHGIAVRTGHHCAQPSLRHFGLEATVRPSFAMYNRIEEVELLLDVVRRVAKR